MTRERIKDIMLVSITLVGLFCTLDAHKSGLKQGRAEQKRIDEAECSQQLKPSNDAANLKGYLEATSKCLEGVKKSLDAAPAPKPAKAGKRPAIHVIEHPYILFESNEIERH